MENKSISDIIFGKEETLITGSIASDKVFEYIKSNIPGSDDIAEQFLEQYEGCNCKENCCSDVCTCLQQFGNAYNIDGTIKDCILTGSSQPVLECGNLCACNKLICNNRVVQRGIKNKLQVFRTDLKGYGLRSVENVPAFSFICEYAGEVINQQDAKSRMSFTELNGKDNYLIVVREFVQHKVLSTYVDPHNIGNVGRFINHSCDPNLIMVPVRINHSVPRLALFASKNLGAGEEITFDYSGFVSPPPNGPDDTQLSSQNMHGFQLNKDALYEVKHKPCYCGSVLCKGFMPYEKCVL